MASVTKSFKQQCPSCEAMVPVRDPKLIGRKIDCPKCKYRFVVEEPESEPEETPAKKSKKAKPDGVTKDRPAPRSKGAGGKGRRDEDNPDRPPKKKKGGNSTMLILGIALAVIAVGALGVGGYLLFAPGSKSSRQARSTGGGGSGASTIPVPSPGTPGTPTPGGQPGKKLPKKPTRPAGPVAPNITNLLPNDSEVVMSVPVERTLGSSLRTATLEVPGGFKAESFERKMGFPISDVEQVVNSVSITNKWVFSVVRTKKVLDEQDLVKRLQATPEPPIKGRTFYRVQGELDSLGNLLFKVAQHSDRFNLFFLDSRTLVFADYAPMKKFLEDETKPKYITQPPRRPPMPPGGPRPGNPGGEGPGATTPPTTPGGGRYPARPPGTGTTSAGAGGYTPTTGTPSQGTPGGSPATSGRTTSGRAPAGRATAGKRGPQAIPSYLTVDEKLKKVLDRVEKTERKRQTKTLFAVGILVNRPALHRLILDTLKEFPGATQAELEQVREGLAKAKQIHSIGLGLLAMNQENLSAVISAQMQDEPIAKELYESIAKQLEPLKTPFLEKALNLKIVTDDGTKPPPATPGTPTYPGSPMYPSYPGSSDPGGCGELPGEEEPPAVPDPGGCGELPGGEPPGGPMQPGRKPTPSGKPSTVTLLLRDATLSLKAELALKPDVYKDIVGGAAAGMLVLKGQAGLANSRLRIHELAIATQRYLKAKGRFPQGAVHRPVSSGRVLAWRPDQRLSWLTELLPYLGDGSYQVELDPNKSYHEKPNNIAALVVIPHYIGQGQTSIVLRYGKGPSPNARVNVGALSHFVGIAGLGMDAAEYSQDDPATAKKLGIFGYDRVTKPDQIKDGMDQTILLLQVPAANAGLWIIGGGATVRGVSETADAVQPFVSATYNGQRGTFAVMADGTVRFIPATIDPEIFRAMCTIAGGERIRNLDKHAPEIETPPHLLVVRAGTPPPPLPVSSKPKKPTTPAVTPKPPTKVSGGGTKGELDGNWALVSEERLGKKQSIPADKQVLFLFKGNDLRIDSLGRTEKAKITIDPKRKTIDIRPTTGPQAGQTILGIYKLSGEQLTIATSDPRVTVRPDDFTTSPSKRSKVTVLKRLTR